MADVSPISSIIQGSEALVEMGIGYFGGKKADKKAAELERTRPKASSNPEIRSNLSLAESELSSPISAETSQALREGEDSSLATSLGTILKSGGSSNDVASVFANSAEGRQRMASFKEQIRQSKVAGLSNAYQLEANDEKSVFDYNSRQWYDEAQANARQREQYNSLLFGGISDLGGAATNYSTLKTQSNQTDKMLKQQQNMFDTQQQNQMKMFSDYFNPPSSIENTSIPADRTSADQLPFDF